MIGRMNLDSGSYAKRGCNRMLDDMTEASMMSVYCTCGRIVPLDRSEMHIRLGLGKKLECMSCRNARISREIDAMNEHFNGVEGSEETSLRTGPQTDSE